MKIKRFCTMLWSLFAVMPVLAGLVLANPAGATAEANGKVIGIGGVNRPVQAADELILFTRDNPNVLTDANPWCAAVIADYQNGKYMVTSVKDREGAVKIPYNGLVLLGHGTSEQWLLDNLHAGAEVKISGYILPQVILGSVLKLEDGSQTNVDGVDREGGNDELVIFSVNYGRYTPAFGPDTAEAIIANDMVIAQNTAGKNGTYIPDNGYVVCGTGSAAAFVRNMVPGQKITPINLELPSLPAMYFKVDGVLTPITKRDAERGAGEVILYDSAYGASTRTNPWGMEITEVGGKVTKVVTVRSENDVFMDNNSPIPANGHVLSVQSDNPLCGPLSEKVKIGDAITVVTNNIYLYNAGRIDFDAKNPTSREDNPAGWDEVNHQPFLGYRGADQLIIYDSGYGKSTGTNEWGYEAVVNRDHKIISAGGNNSAIPEGGYVMSGHGVKADWLKRYASVGSSVVMDTRQKTVFIRFTPESFMDKAQFMINASKAALDAAQAQFLDVPYKQIQEYIGKAQSLLPVLQNQLGRSNYQGMLDVVANIEADTDRAFYSNFESKKVENRAVWIRPKETSARQVALNLDELKKLNINTVYLETWWGGFTIFPTANPLTQQNPIYKGFDVLKAYLDEGHKRGMSIHCWVENFFIGDSGTENGGPVFAKKPEWLLTSRKGENFQYVEMYRINYYFANPALPEVRDFIMSIYKELVKKYDIDGLQLDYVRYPDAGDGSNDFGYDAYTRKLFGDAYGADPIDIHPGDAMWEKWCKFRADIINTFVYRAVAEIRALKPEIRISADVWPNYVDGPKNLMQEPKDWVTKGYIDNIIPMSYTGDVFSAAADTVNTAAFAKGHAYVTVGLGTNLGLSKAILVGQVGAVSDHGADGTGLFEYESLLGGGYGAQLKAGPYRNVAMIGDNDPLHAVDVLLNDLLRKLKTLYLPNRGISEPAAAALSDRLRRMIRQGRNLASGPLDPGKAATMNRLVAETVTAIDSDSGIEDEVKKRMDADLQNCCKILTNYLARKSFIENHPIERLSMGFQADKAKAGAVLPFEVKAVFKDGPDAIMYLDPSQYKVSVTNPAVIRIENGSLVVEGKGEAEIVVSVTDTFPYKVSTGVIKQTIRIN